MSVSYSFTSTLTRARRIHGALSNNEAHFLYTKSQIGPQKGVIVEIGSFEGRSTTFLASGAKSVEREKVYAIDPHQGGYIMNDTFSSPTYNRFLRNLKNAHVDDWVVPMRKFSADAVKGWKKNIRLLFIDGDHSYDAVKVDIQKWTPHVIDGGIVAFHDVLNPATGPIQAIFDYIVAKPNYKNFGIADSIFYCSKGKPNTFLERFQRSLFIFFLIIIRVILESAENLAIRKIQRLLQQYVVKRWIKNMLTSYSRNNWNTS